MMSLLLSALVLTSPASPPLPRPMPEGQTALVWTQPGNPNPVAPLKIKVGAPLNVLVQVRDDSYVTIKRPDQAFARVAFVKAGAVTALRLDTARLPLGVNTFTVSVRPAKGRAEARMEQLDIDLTDVLERPVVKDLFPPSRFR